MRICIYTNTALPLIGGQEMVVDAHALLLTTLGHDPVVLAPRARACQSADQQLPYTVVRHPPFISTRRFVGWFGRFLTGLHRRHRFDVIHCHSVYPAGYLAARNRERLGCPIVITGHGEHTSARRLENPLLRARFVEAIERADTLIAISDSIRDGYLNLCPQAKNRIIDIPNGVDVTTLSTPVPRPPDLPEALASRRYFLFMGRLKQRKGVDVLLEAFARLPRGSCSLVIAGEGPERHALERAATQYGIAADVQFVGAVAGDAKTWLYQNALCLVAPSRVREGQPLVVLESFAAGRPVIASELPGFTELIRPDCTGLLATAESPDALAAALRRALEDSDGLDRMGHEAKRVAGAHSWKSIIERHVELYESLTSERRILTAAALK